jgi:hypothetical protein
VGGTMIEKFFSYLRIVEKEVSAAGALVVLST